MSKIINGMIHTTFKEEQEKIDKIIENEFIEFLEKNNLKESQENFNKFWKQRVKNKFGYEVK